jgi:hypothetical protein
MTGALTPSINLSPTPIGDYGHNALKIQLVRFDLYQIEFLQPTHHASA